MADEPMKDHPDDENEIHDVLTFKDPSRNRVTPIIQWDAQTATTIIEALQGIVRAGHASEVATSPDQDGVTRAQVFEEGYVYMTSAPYDGYFADRYLMDFYDVTDRRICSRMHLHTGIRYVRIMTGPGTVVRVSSLSPLEIVNVPGVTSFTPEAFTDLLPDTPGGERIDRYNVVVPENSWVDMQVPRGVSHQFNAIGPNAVIDSVHPEESIETFREQMSGLNMTAQTVFLAEELPDSSTCEQIPSS